MNTPLLFFTIMFLKLRKLLGFNGKSQHREGDHSKSWTISGSCVGKFDCLFGTNVWSLWVSYKLTVGKALV